MEKAAKPASECCNYINANNTQIAILFYYDNTVLRVRIGGIRGN